jgi:UDP-glucuronate 4-epimerase
MKILITGAAGFIGGNLLAKVQDLGISVIGIDSFTSYYSPDMKEKRVNQLNISEIIKRIDIGNEDELRGVFRQFKPTHVVHLAAQGGVRASKIDPKPYLLSNQVGFLNTLSISEEMGVEKFIFASSSSVYGDGVKAPFKESDQISAPKSLYALSKLSNELIAKYLPMRNTERIGLRLFTVYGPWGRPDMAIYRLLASSLLNQNFELTAAQDLKRDFTFVDDVSKIILEISSSNNKELSSNIFNVAGGKPYSMSELLTILENLGLNLKVNQKSQDELDLNLTHASTEKIKKFGISVPDTPLNSGIEQTWRWINSQSKNDISKWLASSV